MATTPPPPRPEFTANDRLKGSFTNWFWGSIAIAAMLHFVVLAFFPDMTAADASFNARVMDAYEIPPEVEIPPPPEQIQRPAIPVISTNVDINEDITITPPTFEENPVTDLPPPPQGASVDVSDQPTFTPYEIEPEMRNKSEYVRALERSYPSTLKDAGIGGTVRVWLFINESGTVTNTKVVETSGYPQLDQAALTATKVLKFTPALNRDQKVPVWIQFPVTFQVS
jgi:protein TonB